MSQKIVTVTIKNLDVTQLTKIRDYFSNNMCHPSNYQGAYMRELRELVDTILQNTRQGVNTFEAPGLTIY